MTAFLTAVSLATTASDPWADEFFGMDQGQRFVIILTLIGCFTGIVIALAGILYSAFDAAHRRRTEAALKQEMLDRGMGVEEIVKVVEAAPVPESDYIGRWISCWGKRK
ncbi:MAG TPA: hypothetical protein VF175_17970 [Lacipirellula sp.]